MGETTSNLFYLVTIICFILALRFLSSPTTARRGNWIGAFGMVVAIVVTLLHHGLHVGWRIPVGGAIGTVFGAVDDAAQPRHRTTSGSPTKKRCKVDMDSLFVVPSVRDCGE